MGRDEMYITKDGFLICVLFLLNISMNGVMDHSGLGSIALFPYTITTDELI